MVSMPQTLNNTYESKVIGGIFSNRENADKAVKAFQDSDISPENIQIIQLDRQQTKDPCASFLVSRGFTHSQALYYDKAVRVGRILVAVYEVADLDRVIETFSKYHAQYQLEHKQPDPVGEDFP
jgi:hypothetical protein